MENCDKMDYYANLIKGLKQSLRDDKTPVGRFTNKTWFIWGDIRQEWSKDITNFREIFE